MESDVLEPQGAVGGGMFEFDETSSIMNHQSSLLSGNYFLLISLKAK